MASFSWSKRAPWCADGLLPRLSSRLRKFGLCGREPRRRGRRSRIYNDQGVDLTHTGETQSVSNIFCWTFVLPPTHFGRGNTRRLAPQVLLMWPSDEPRYVGYRILRQISREKPFLMTSRLSLPHVTLPARYSMKTPEVVFICKSSPLKMFIQRRNVRE